MRRIKSVISRRKWRLVLVVAVTTLGVLLIAGCGPSGSTAAQAQHLEQQYPWLANLGLAFVEWLIQTYGSDIAALLAVALSAL
jgi:hypothetical protein